MLTSPAGGGPEPAQIHALLSSWATHPTPDHVRCYLTSMMDQQCQIIWKIKLSMYNVNVAGAKFLLELTNITIKVRPTSLTPYSI